MNYVFGEGDQVVIRCQPSTDERWGKVEKVRGNGAAEVFLPKMKGWSRESRVLIQANGHSMLGAFMVIKHVTKAEFEATAGIPKGDAKDGLLRK